MGPFARLSLFEPTFVFLVRAAGRERRGHGRRALRAQRAFGNGTQDIALAGRGVGRDLGGWHRRPRRRLVDRSERRRLWRGPAGAGQPGVQIGHQTVDAALELALRVLDLLDTTGELAQLLLHSRQLDFERRGAQIRRLRLGQIDPPQRPDLGPEPVEIGAQRAGIGGIGGTTSRDQKNDRQHSPHGHPPAPSGSFAVSWSG